MQQCNNGYKIKKDYSPPSRCHFDGKYDYPNCKSCPYYNHEYDLIYQAIEYTKRSIHRLKQNKGSILTNPMKEERQRELMKITIKALEYYRDES